MLTQVTPLERCAAAALLAVLRGEEWEAAILLDSLPPAELARVLAAARTLASLALPLDPEGKPRVN
jgi:hypothetical protein